MQEIPKSSPSVSRSRLRLRLRSRSLALAFAIVVAGAATSTAHADEVTGWAQAYLRAGLVTGTPPYVMARSGAIVSGAVFDAINGIERRYTSVHVDPAGPASASTGAAAVQAAYATLVQLFPTQKGVFDAKRAVSLALLAMHEDAAAIDSGISWGQAVADAILAWRSTDGFTSALPPFLGGLDPGMWRPTPPGFVPGVAQQFATMTPWVIASPSQFRPAGPPALTSAQYAANFNETKMLGSATSATRTLDQKVLAYFWASNNVNYFWDMVAINLLERGRDDDRAEESGHGKHNRALLEHARILALVNLALADAGIALFDAKYTYVWWRPVTAIPLGDTDGNPATTADATWTPLIVTPAHPEYPSAHSSYSGAAAVTLAHEFGERTRFIAESDLLPGVTRSFRSFSAALDEIATARIAAGIHFRSACDDGRVVGAAVANYILEHALQPLNGTP
jgi:hypothetical protein